MIRLAWPWPPPPEKRRPERAENQERAGPEPVRHGTGTSKITPQVPAWQEGVSPILIIAVALWRRARPIAPLPGRLQRAIAHAWMEAAP